MEDQTINHNSNVHMAEKNKTRKASFIYLRLSTYRTFNFIFIIWHFFKSQIFSAMEITSYHNF